MFLIFVDIYININYLLKLCIYNFIVFNMKKVYQGGVGWNIKMKLREFLNKYLRLFEN